MYFYEPTVDPKDLKSIRQFPNPDETGLSIESIPLIISSEVVLNNTGYKRLLKNYHKIEEKNEKKK